MTDKNIKRSVTIAGHRTSITLEAPFWNALKEIAAIRKQSVNALIGTLEDTQQPNNLSSAIRVFVLAHYKTRKS